MDIQKQIEEALAKRPWSEAELEYIEANAVEWLIHQQSIISQQAEEIDKYKLQLSQLCPIGGFDTITSLQAEKSHMANEIKHLKAYKTLSELQDKLLICYRIGKNPGNLLDKLAAARKKVKEETP